MTDRLSTPANTSVTDAGGRISPAWTAFLQHLCDALAVLSADASADGEIVVSACAERDGDWLPCDGRMLKRAEYPALFAAIGVTYGGGADTFAVPSVAATPWGGTAFIRTR